MMRIIAAFLMVALSATSIGANGTSGPVSANRHRSGGTFSPSGVASVKRWITADALGGSLSNNDPISTATDQSGNSNNLTQSGSARPTYQTSITNGLPGMLFTLASTQSLTGSAVSASAVSFFIAFKPVSITSDVELVGTDAGNTYYRFSGNGDGYFGSFRSARIDNYPAAVPTTGIHIISIISTSSGYEVWLDGVSQGSQTASFSQGSTFILGADSGGAKPWNGYVFEVIECNADVGGTVRGQFETYLTRWQ